MPQVTGRVFINIAGNRVDSKEGASLKYGGVEREAVIADRGVVGPMEKLTAPEIKCTIVHTKDVSLKDLQDVVDANISFDTDTGRSFVIIGGFYANGLELSKGEMQVTFMGTECTEN